MLYLVGLGLGDVKDITVRGLEIVKKADRIYLEAYTSLLTVDKGDLVSVCRGVRTTWEHACSRSKWLKSVHPMPMSVRAIIHMREMKGHFPHGIISRHSTQYKYLCHNHRHFRGSVILHFFMSIAKQFTSLLVYNRIEI